MGAWQDPCIVYHTLPLFDGSPWLVYASLVQLLLATPFMWSCWNACVDVEIRCTHALAAIRGDARRVLKAPAMPAGSRLWRG
jgi:hypothetical protein